MNIHEKTRKICTGGNNASSNSENCTKTKKINIQNDSSEVSSIDENDNNDVISTMAEQDYINNELVEKIMKYFVIDNRIREKQKEIREEMKELKDKKSDLEKFILRFLNETEQNFIEVSGQGKLMKKTSTRVGAINQVMIKESIKEMLIKENIICDEIEIECFVDNVLKTIDDMRPKTTKEYIYRSEDNTNKTKKIRKTNKTPLTDKRINKTTKIEDINDDEIKYKIGSDDELPKY